MKDTKILETNDTDLKIGAELICDGGTVIFPTETVYGLGANALDEEAVRKIFIAKGRPSDNPLIVHIDSFDKIYNYVEEVTPIAKKLADYYWPGPMTLILRKKACIPSVVSAGLNTVGIRIPENKFARKFIEYCNLPIAAPSANLSGSPSPTTKEHVINDMMGRVDAIICGEKCEVGVESTVVDVTGEIPVILRPGGITPDMIEEVCGRVIIDKGVKGVSDTEKPKSPGMKYKHYAPNAEVVLIEGDNVVEKIKETITSYKDNFIILCTEETKDNFIDYPLMCLGSKNKPEIIAQNLFDAFRECDKRGYKTIILEGISEDGIGLAVMNRAYRAAKK